MTLKNKARVLRKNQTDAEKLLRYYLKNRNLQGHKFRRQYPIGSYIVDFVCCKQKLIVELDGGQHMEQQVYDQKRTDFLENKNYHVLRFWNNDVTTHTNVILETLTLALSQRERELRA